MCVCVGGRGVSIKVWIVRSSGQDSVKEEKDSKFETLVI